jgi:hypothetical protein
MKTLTDIVNENDFNLPDREYGAYVKHIDENQQLKIVISGSSFGGLATNDSWMMALHIGQNHAPALWMSSDDYRNIEEVYIYLSGLAYTIESYQVDHQPSISRAPVEKEPFTFERGLFSMFCEWAVVVDKSYSRNPKVREFSMRIEPLLQKSDLIYTNPSTAGASEDLILFCKTKEVANEITTFAESLDIPAYVVDGRPTKPLMH